MKVCWHRKGLNDINNILKFMISLPPLNVSTAMLFYRFLLVLYQTKNFVYIVFTLLLLNICLTLPYFPVYKSTFKIVIFKIKYGGRLIYRI